MPLTNIAQGATWVYLVRDRNNGAPAASAGVGAAGADVYQEPVGDSLSSGSILWGNDHDSSENHSGSTSSTGSAGVCGSAREEDFLSCSFEIQWESDVKYNFDPEENYFISCFLCGFYEQPTKIFSSGVD